VTAPAEFQDDRGATWAFARPPEAAWQVAVVLTEPAPDLWASSGATREGDDLVWHLVYDKHGPDRRDVDVLQRGEGFCLVLDSGHFRRPS